MRLPHSARLLFLLGVLACEANLTTTEPRSEAPAVGLDAPVGTSDLTSASTTCPNCTFEPQIYTRATGTPETNVIEFEGNPAGAYVLETDDFRGQGAESRLWLNGTRRKVGVGMERQDVVLDWQNTLEVRLTGKPGSKLQVRIYQEVASVEVTPGAARARIPANTQFTAVARDTHDPDVRWRLEELGGGIAVGWTPTPVRVCGGAEAMPTAELSPLEVAPMMERQLLAV